MVDASIVLRMLEAVSFGLVIRCAVPLALTLGISHVIKNSQYLASPPQLPGRRMNGAGGRNGAHARG